MRSTLFSGLLTAAILTIAACNNAGPPPKKDVITQALAEPNVFILDVRSPSEFAGGHVEGAINIAVADLSSKQALLPTAKDQQIVVHCAAGVRSAKAATALGEMGYTKVLDAKTPDAVATALGKPLVK